MKKLMVVVLVGVLAGCGSSNSSNNGNAPAPGASGLGGSFAAANTPNKMEANCAAAGCNFASQYCLLLENSSGVLQASSCVAYSGSISKDCDGATGDAQNNNSSCASSVYCYQNNSQVMIACPSN